MWALVLSLSGIRYIPALFRKLVNPVFTATEKLECILLHNKIKAYTQNSLKGQIPELITLFLTPVVRQEWLTILFYASSTSNDSCCGRPCRCYTYSRHAAIQLTPSQQFREFPLFTWCIQRLLLNPNVSLICTNKYDSSCSVSTSSR